MRRASAAIDSARSRSRTTERIAVAIAAGLPWGTMRPAPLLSSSTAWGNAVAMTGRPAAMASTSTPEVTWSFESYGSRTACAEAMKSVSCAVLRY